MFKHGRSHVNSLIVKMPTRGLKHLLNVPVAHQEPSASFRFRNVLCFQGCSCRGLLLCSVLPLGRSYCRAQQQVTEYEYTHRATQCCWVATTCSHWLRFCTCCQGPGHLQSRHSAFTPKAAETRKSQVLPDSCPSLVKDQRGNWLHS